MKQIFIAKNDRQLGICARLLYSEGVSFHMEVKQNDKNKIYFELEIDMDDLTYLKLLDKYKIMIS